MYCLSENDHVFKNTKRQSKTNIENTMTWDENVGFLDDDSFNSGTIYRH